MSVQVLPSNVSVLSPALSKKLTTLGLRYQSSFWWSIPLDEDPALFLGYPKDSDGDLFPAYTLEELLRIIPYPVTFENTPRPLVSVLTNHQFCHTLQKLIRGSEVEALGDIYAKLLSSKVFTPN